MLLDQVVVAEDVRCRQYQHHHDKARIAHSFARQAKHYHALARVQQQIAEDAAALLRPTSGTLLDIGCGTGNKNLSKLASSVIGLDLAFGMLSQAQHSDATPLSMGFVQADAESLPFGSSSLQRVFSSMALQWCHDLFQALDEIKRVLAPTGQTVVAIPVAGTLAELAECWLALDGYQRVNRFETVEQILTLARLTGLHASISKASYRVTFNDIASLLSSIKSVGAGTILHSVQPPALTRTILSRLQAIYAEKFGRENGLPLTYQVAFLQLEKTQ